MFTKNVNGQVLRKSSFSGDQGGGQDSGGNCVFVTPQAATTSFVHDSKGELNLFVAPSARHALVSALTAHRIVR